MAAFAEERLEQARQALIATGYFTADQVGDDIAPRIIELASHYTHEGNTTGWIHAGLDAIRQVAEDDFERAHSLEDDLRRRILQAIADGASNPAGLAALALQSAAIEFQRCCA